MITVISGPMFASKSKRLIQYLTGAMVRNLPVMAIKPAQDDRTHAKNIYSYDGSAFPAEEVEKEDELERIKSKTYKLWNEPQHILALDEAQFFDTDTLLVLCSRYHQTSNWLFLSGLVKDSEGGSFGGLGAVLHRKYPRLSHEQLTARCSFCHGKATHTFCKVEKTGQILTGRDIYEPRCEPCWMFGQEGKV